MKFKLSSNYLFILIQILINLICSLNGVSYYDEPLPILGNDDSSSSSVLAKSTSDLNKEFWETMYQNSMLNMRTKYNALNDEKVCFTCPIDRNTFTSLYHEALESLTSSQQTPPRVTISWAAQLNENRVIFFCSNNTRKAPNPLYLSTNTENSNEISASSSTQLEYSCENNRLCLSNIKNSYPKNYQCMIKSYILNVRLDVIVQLTHVLLYFTGDSVKFDYQKEVQVHENQVFTVKCEVPESNPVSIVSAYIDNKELKLTGLEKKTVESRMTINTYSFDVNATRNMNGKRVKCDAQMKDIPPELANSIDLRSHLFKDYTISVYYLPTCVYKERVYRTGINRSIIIECPINGSNPDVTYYKMIPPSTRTKFELIDNNIETLRRVGRYRINPTSQADFGLYECIPRSLAGTAKCDIIVELGSTPNPPEQCNVQFAKVNNKTFAQFSCKPGHNQGGSVSFLSIYEIVDKQLKLSGRVNIDEGKLDKEVPYITPADEDKYYEFLIMQENNFGNSSSIILTLGTSRDSKPMNSIDFKNIYMIGGVIAGVMLFFCLCGCCCCSDICTSSKSDSAFCKCCSSSDHNDDDGLTYKKAPMDSDALGGSTSSRSYPYSSDLNGTMKLGYNSNMNSNYEYYDNTSAGLLDANNFLKNDPYNQHKSRKNQVPNSLSYDNNNQDDSYNHNYEDDDNDHYMNDHEERMNNKRNDLDDDHDDNYSENDNQDDSLTSSGQKSNDDDQQGFIPAPAIPISKNPSAIFNNNVSVSIGSGVESIKKHTYNLNQNNSEIYGSRKQNTVKFSNNNTYTTVDRKNMKLIKTDNGLVYTPLNDGKGKNSDGISSEENDQDHEITYDYDNCDEQPNKYKESNKLITNNNYSSLKKTNSINNNNNTNTSKMNGINHPNNTFQAELSMKLKSINKIDEKSIKQDNEIYSKNMKLQNSTSKQSGLLPSASYTQSEPLSNSTATTSVSSASSCASNSDLIIKKDSLYATAKRPLPTQNSNNNTNNDTSNLNTNTLGKNYSLLKTTINVNNNNNSNNNNDNEPINANGTLNRNRPNNNSNTNTLTKPPILKPKPRNNNIYQSTQLKKHLNSTSESLHNQSVEPLLNQTKQEFSFQTSPSTSVTDVSSTNCTPQHYNTNLIEEIGQVNSILNKQSTMTRSRSNSLTKQSHGKIVTTTFGAKTTTISQTSNTTTSANNSNSIYSTIKLNGDYLKANNNTMKTFSPNNTCDTSSLLRKLDNIATIDDEINAINHLTNGVNKNKTNSILNTNSNLTRTMERRHVKNSEC